MAKRVNSAVIGGFVVAAIALLLSSILIFSSGNFFKKRYQFIMFFDDNVAGLNVGAPVKFRGVEIGSVKSITLQASTETLQVDIPIIVEVDPQKFHTQGGRRAELHGNIKRLIEKGLRARLDIQSFVTGQYYIQIDFLPDTEVRLRGIDSEYTEIPTVKSSLTKLSETFRDLPIKDIVENVEEITRMLRTVMEKENFEQLVNGLSELLENVNSLVTDTNQFVGDLQKQTGTLGGELSEVLSAVAKDINSITASTNMLLDSLNSEVGPVTSEIHAALSSAQQAFDDASTTFATAEKLLGDSEVRFKLGRVLDEMAAGAKSIRELGEYLERHPESLLQGKQKSRRGGS